eukprot:scaffold4544_cov332-Ochromonas_danica.AAC.2
MRDISPDSQWSIQMVSDQGKRKVNYCTNLTISKYAHCVTGIEEEIDIGSLFFEMVMADFPLPG